MTPPPIPARPNAEALLAQTGWIRGLAQRLVGDPERAADLVQETWLVALRGGGSPSRSFLGGIVRNLFRRELRGDARRRAREEVAARPAESSSTLDVVARAATQRELVDAVLALDEPFRTAILLRYFEGHTPRVIAEQQGVSVRTVNSRLTRGLERLRARLEREFGGRAEWTAALAPFAFEVARRGAPRASIASGATGSASLSSTLGALVVNAKVVLSAAAVTLAIGAVVVWSRASREGAEPAIRGAASLSAGDATLAGHRELEVTELAEPERSPVSNDPGETVAAAARDEKHEWLRGRVFDAHGDPLSGLEVELVAAGGRAETLGAGELRAISGPGGVFALRDPGTPGQLRATDPAFVTVFSGLHRPPSSFESFLVVARSVDFAGRVVDEEGTPLEGARVTLTLPDLRPRFREMLESTDKPGWKVLTRPDGSFDLSRSPLVEGATILAQLPGFEPHVAPPPARSDRNLEIVLARPARVGGEIAGRVVDPSGYPVQGARVGMGADLAVTGRDGTFHIDAEGEGDAFELFAVRPGFRGGSYVAEKDPATGEPLWPEYVEIRLEGPPLSIAGRVVDENGHPLENRRVWIRDPSHFGMVDGMHAHVEFILGLPADPSGGSEAARSPFLDFEGDEPDMFWNFVTTDARGAFRIDGLLERDYRLVAMSFESLQKAESDSIPAGTQGVEIVMSSADLRERIAGRVVTASGAAVPGAVLDMARFTFSADDHSGIFETREFVTSGPDGSFEFLDVPREGCFLRVRGEAALPAFVYLPDEGDFENLEVVVSVRCHLQVILSGNPDRADSVVALDGQDQPISIYRIDGSGSTRTSSAKLQGGRSGTLGVPDEARTLLLLLEGTEVERVPLSLVPGILNRIEL